jgi:hypothetical protein
LKVHAIGVDRLRGLLIALLVVSTALFAVGVIAERSEADEHTEPATAQVAETGEAEGTHEEGEEAGAGEQPAGEEAHDDDGEALLGVDLESTPLVVLAVIAGLGLAALAATRFGRLLGFLFAVCVIALAWAVLDIREVVHQLDDSRTGIAVVAAIVAALHLAAAAVSGRLARQVSPTP